jgi:hypothetical protein
MDHLDEILDNLKSVDPILIQEIRMLERILFFKKLRELIHEKDSINDTDASNILGWAYERLAD